MCTHVRMYVCSCICVCAAHTFTLAEYIVCQLVCHEIGVQNNWQKLLVRRLKHKFFGFPFGMRCLDRKLNYMAH